VERSSGTETEGARLSAPDSAPAAAAAASRPRDQRRGRAGPDLNPHAPQRGWLGKLLGPFHVTGVFWFRFHAFGARRSEGVIRLAIPLFTFFFFLTIHRIRRAVAANLVPVLGECGWWQRQRRIWRLFHTVAWSQTERYERLFTDRPFAVELENRRHWDAVREAGGVVLLTGHVGNWEMASALPSAEEGHRVHVVREEEMDPRAQKFVQDHLRRRAGNGYVTHFAGHTDPRLGLQLREALQRGEMVALQGDRPRRGSRTVEVQLFGRPYQVPAGPFAVARQAGAPVMPSFVFRTGRRRYVLRCGAPIRVPQDQPRDQALAEAARSFAAELESAVRREPYQWFVFREIWGG
jgi:predicted LPLAT superfamily acyltransferase